MLPFVKANISFCTMSVVAPTPRATRSVGSKMGVRISAKLNRRITSRTTPSAHRHAALLATVLPPASYASGRMSKVPLMF